MLDYNKISDDDLHGMCIRGDEGAWQYIYNYIYKCLRETRWYLKYGIEEMAQEITVHLIEKAIFKVRDKSKFKHFIRVMTINKIKDSFRSITFHSLDEPIKTKYGEDYIPEIIDTNSNSPEDQINSFEVFEIINNSIKKLSKSCQIVVVEYIKFKLGLYEDYKELSRALDMPIPTISSSVRRCLNKLIGFKEIDLLRP